MRTQFGTNIVEAQRKRVYYEGTSDIAEGMPLCYNFDTVDNILGYDKGAGGRVDSQSTPDTTAEGNQNEGKYLRVEDPALGNLGAFAGVVAGTSEAGKTGPRWLDIFVANGAIVPVKTVLAATVVGRTILCINSGTLTLGNPTTDVPNYATTSSADTAGSIDARPVAVAWETLSSAGLLLAKLDTSIFVHQGGQIDYEMEVAAGAVDVSVNRMHIDFKNTAGHCQALHYRANLQGTGGDANQGVYRFDTFMQAVPAANKLVFGVKSHLEIGADWNTEGGHCSPLQLTVRTKNVDPDLSGLGVLSAINIDWILRKTTTTALTNPPRVGCIMYVNEDSTGTIPDYFIYAERYGSIGIGTDALGGSAHACARTMKIVASNIELFIPVYTAAELAA